MPRSVKKISAKKTSAKSTKTLVQQPVLPGYFGFSKEVLTQLSDYKRVVTRLLMLTTLTLLLVAGLGQNSQYAELSGAAQEVSSLIATGFMKYTLEVGSLLISTMSGSYVSALPESQQLYMTFIYLALWLVTVWLLRHLLSGSSVKLRDGLYNAGAPLLSTVLVGLVGLLQLLPFALFVALLSIVSSNGVLGGSLVLIAGMAVVIGLFAATVYWLVGTLFAAVIVTIPGTYPMAALRSAKKLIAGHRTRVFKRILWLIGLVFLVYMSTLLFLIALDVALGHHLSLLVTVGLQLLNVSLFIYSATYIYVLYRRVIDERTD